MTVYPNHNHASWLLDHYAAILDSLKKKDKNKNKSGQLKSPDFVDFDKCFLTGVDAQIVVQDIDHVVVSSRTFTMVLVFPAKLTEEETMLQVGLSDLTCVFRHHSLFQSHHF